MVITVCKAFESDRHQLSQTRPMPHVKHIYYEEAGSGPPVILIHCPALNHIYWRPIVDRLQQHCRCIAPDLRGHGRTGLGAHPWDFGDAANDVLLLARTLGLSRAVLAGYSAGACIALEASLAAPDLFGGLILVSGFSECSTLYLKARVCAGIAASRLGLSGLVGSSIVSSNNVGPAHAQAQLPHARAVHPESLRSFLGAALRVKLTERLPMVRPAALLVYGEKDEQMHPYARKLAAGLRESRTLMLPGSDHRVPTRRPDLFAEAVTGFVQHLAP